MGHDYNAPRETNDSHIARVRREKGITQAQLAERLGIKQPMIARWETGKRKPKIETLMRIAKALGVQWTELWGYTKEDNGGR